jgi:hypothetical protein
MEIDKIQEQVNNTILSKPIQPSRRKPVFNKTNDIEDRLKLVKRSNIDVKKQVLRIDNITK